jgi:hypothetical protein
MSHALTFESERFDYRSELPAEYNAGNRFYGKDLAAYLAEGLSERGFASDFLDEDWGWLVFATRDAREDHEVAVYNLSEHREGGRPGVSRWGLWIRQHERRKALLFFSRRTEVEVSPALLEAVRGCVQASGATPADWVDAE